MTFEISLEMIVTAATIAVTPVLYIWRSIIYRIASLEESNNRKVDKEEVRLMLEDKLVPLKEDLAEIKNSIDKIRDYLLNK